MRYILVLLLFPVVSFATISDGQRVNAANTNAAFMSRIDDTDTFGDITIKTRSQLNLEDTTGGEFVGFVAPSSISSSFTLTLPDSDGTADYCLSTNGSSTLQWVACLLGVTEVSEGGTGTSTPPTDGQLLFGTSGGAYNLAGVSGTANEVEATSTSSGLEIGLPNDVTIAGLLTSASSTSGEYKMTDDDASHSTTLTAASNTTASVTYQLPPADGSSGQCMQTDGSGVMSWGDCSGSGSASSTDVNLLSNVGVAASATSSTMEINLTQADGSTPNSSNPVYIAFRNSSETSGGYGVASSTSATSLTIPSGATIGSIDNGTTTAYLYAINNASSVELAVSLTRFDESLLHDTEAIGASSSSSTSLYSTSARTDVAVRLIGAAKWVQSTAGTYATQPYLVYTGNRHREKNTYGRSHSGMTIPYAIQTPIDYPNAIESNMDILYTPGSGYNSGTGTWSTEPKWEILRPGVYRVNATLRYTGDNTGLRALYMLAGAKGSSPSLRAVDERYPDSGSEQSLHVQWTQQVQSGFVIQIETTQIHGGGSSTTTLTGAYANIRIQRLGDE